MGGIISYCSLLADQRSEKGLLLLLNAGSRIDHRGGWLEAERELRNGSRPNRRRPTHLLHLCSLVPGV